MVKMLSETVNSSITVKQRIHINKAAGDMINFVLTQVCHMQEFKMSDFEEKRTLSYSFQSFKSR